VSERAADTLLVDEIELGWRTPPAWARAALSEPLELLSDHAHCELRAATTAQALILRRTTDPEFVARLGAHAAEELAHFRRVLRVLHARGGDLLPAHANPYMEKLHRRSAGTRANALLDRLLIAALIERRSHERFELLAAAAADAGDAELAALYTELEPSERGHALLFVELAHRVASPEAPEVVGTRLADLIADEAAAARDAPFAPRIHGGPPRVDGSGVAPNRPMIDA